MPGKLLTIKDHNIVVDIGVAFFPSLADLHGNPYWSQLAKHLELYGVRVLPNTPRVLRLRWLWQHRRHVPILHVHYFQDNYAYEGTRARLRWVVRFARNLVIARLLGYHIVWTVHNETPSFPLHPKWAENLAHFAVARLANSVIVHCRYAKDMVLQRYGQRNDIFIVPHPNYIGVYPGDPTRTEARSALRLPLEAIVLLCFGQLRPNKGIESLLAVFADLPGDHLRLVIAGAPGPDSNYVAKLTELASKDRRVVLSAEYVPDDRVLWYYAAADIAFAPLARVLTSGSALLAMSLGVPVIAPKSGCLPETLPEDSGWLYDPKEPTELPRVLRHAIASDLRTAGARARSRAESLTWEACAEATVCAYGLPRPQ